MNEEYIRDINNLTESVIEKLKEFKAFGNQENTKKSKRIPTQASSDFLIHKEQGDYAERVVFEDLNKEASDYAALRYGRNDDISAGDQGFKDFYRAYQEELESIGKKPDLLIIPKVHMRIADLDISAMSGRSQKYYLEKAIAGLEVRSSSYSYEEHESYVEEILKENKTKLERKYLELRKLISKDSQSSAFDDIRDFGSDIDLPKASKSDSKQIRELRKDYKQLQTEIGKTKKSLNFTVKVEDIISIKRWIDNYGVRHFFVQVMYDRIFMISFGRVLQIVSDEDDYEIAKDSRNQFKSTIKIPLARGYQIGIISELPELKVENKLLQGGRVIYPIRFRNGKAEVNTSTVAEIINSDL